jgi:hypothetical protein
MLAVLACLAAGGLTMAAIRRLTGNRSKPRRVEIRRKGSESIGQCFRTKREATDFAAKVEADFDRWAKPLGGELKRDTVADLLDRYMAGYHGKDVSVVARAGWWKDKYGERPLSEFNGDTVREGLASLSEGTARQGGPTP